MSRVVVLAGGLFLRLYTHTNSLFEIATFVRLYPTSQVFVFEEQGQDYVPIQTYGKAGAEKQVSMLYRNAVHWDVLLRRS